jgi:hypothetical protein
MNKQKKIGEDLREEKTSFYLYMSMSVFFCLIIFSL